MKTKTKTKTKNKQNAQLWLFNSFSLLKIWLLVLTTVSVRTSTPKVMRWSWNATGIGRKRMSTMRQDLPMSCKLWHSRKGCRLRWVKLSNLIFFPKIHIFIHIFEFSIMVQVMMWKLSDASLKLEDSRDVILSVDIHRYTLRHWNQGRKRTIFQRGQRHFPYYFPSVKCFFPVEKKKRKGVLSSFCNFSSFHFQLSTFPLSISFFSSQFSLFPLPLFSR